VPQITWHIFYVRKRLLDQKVDCSKKPEKWFLLQVFLSLRENGLALWFQFIPVR